MLPKPLLRLMPCILLLLAGGIVSAHAQRSPADSRSQLYKPLAGVQELLDKADLLTKQSKWQDALKGYADALEKARGLQDRTGEAVALRKAGVVYANAGQPQKALSCYEQALAIHKALGDRNNEANVLLNTGIVFLNKGQPQKAREYFEQALSLYRAVGDRSGEAKAINNLGIIYRNTGQPEKALAYYEQCLPVLRALGDHHGEADTLNNIGTVYSYTGQPQKALTFHGQALPIYRAEGDKGSEARTLNNIGTIYQYIGRLQEALTYYEQALAALRDVGDKRSQAFALNNIGNTYLDIGQPRKAQEFFEQALPIYRDAGDKAGEASALHNLGNARYVLNESKQALEAYQQVLEIHRTMGNKSGESGDLLGIGSIYEETGQAQKALETYQEVLAIKKAIGETDGQAKALVGMANVYRSTGELQKALENYEQARAIFKTEGDKREQINTFYEAASVARKLHRLPEALASSRQSVALLEEMRSALGGFSEAKSLFLSSKLPVYYQMLGLLLEQGHTEEAFDLAQKTKARALLDLLASGRVDFEAALTPEERRKQQELRQRADFLNAQMVKEGVVNEVGAKARFSALQKELKQIENELQTLTDTLHARHPRLADERAATTAALVDIGHLLPAHTALLEYVQAAREKLVLFVVTSRQGKLEVHSYVIPIKESDLQKQCAGFHAACSDPRKPWQAQAAALYSLLLKPAEKQLMGKMRLVVCPDGPLWDVPFAALRSIAGRMLLDRCEIVTAYSATGMQAAIKARTAQKSRAGTILVVANPEFGATKRFGDLDDLPGQRPIDRPSRPIDKPSRRFDDPARPLDRPSRPFDRPSRPFDSPSRPIDRPSRQMATLLERGGGRIASLPGTQREAVALRRDFRDAKVYTGAQAQEDAAKQEMGKYRYLHFATHGFFNDASPMLSSIVLAQPTPGSKEDGFLTAREIFNLDLSGVEMTVLSACNTARGQTRTGEGVIGLTWALFAAGCPTQVVSQWSVDDASTATLMATFYGRLKQGESKGAALRAAALKLLHDGKHSHPYYWAPFVLVGDWK